MTSSRPDSTKETAVRHHLLIGGTGRAGTSLLVKVLAACDMQTVLAGDKDKLFWSETANAGLEMGRYLEDAPYVLKFPLGANVVRMLAQRPDVKIDGIVIPVRNLAEAASSRIVIDLYSAYEGMQPDSNSWPVFVYQAAGGGVYPLEPLDQARVLAKEFHEVIETLLDFQIPIYFLKFPKFVSDSDYLYEQLRPILPGHITGPEFRSRVAGVLDVSKVRVSDELKRDASSEQAPDGATVARAVSGVEDDKATPSFMQLENIALKRKVQALLEQVQDAGGPKGAIAGRIKQAEEQAAFYKRGYDDVYLAFTQTQTALSQTQAALRQTQHAYNVLQGTADGALPIAETLDAETVAAETAQSQPAETRIVIDQVTTLPKKSIDELLSESQPGSCLYRDEVYFDVKQHPLSVISTIESEQAFYRTHSVRAPEMVLERLQDHYWLPQSGFLVSPQGKVWRHSVLGQFGDPHFLTTHAVQNRENSDGTTDYIFHESLLRDSPVIDEMRLITSHYGSHNYGHYMLDMVPLLHVGGELGLPMLSKQLSSWQKSIIPRTGADIANVRECDLRVVRLKDFIVSNRHNAVSTYCASPHHRAVYEDILRRVPEGTQTGRCKKLFLSRSTSKARNISNRDALEKVLGDRGFHVLLPDQLSFDQQARMFSEAELIVSEFGAVMANVVFCKPGTRIVEIIPEGQNDPWSVHMCAALGLEHVVLFHKVDDSDREALEIGGRALKNINFKFSANIDLITSVVDQLR